MNLQDYSRNVNFHRLIFLLFFLIFLTLCLLSIDKHIVIINAWLLFTPLWIWNILVFTCFILLFLIKFITFTKFIAFYLIYQVHILLFQIFICFKLVNNYTFPWSIVLIPAYGLCILGFLTVTKDFRRLNIYELEIFLSLNLPCIILIGLRLDDYIHWNWTEVLIPFWITMTFLVIQLLHGLLLVGMLCGSNHFNQQDRNETIIRITGYFFVAFSFLIFSILLVCRLDKIKLFTNKEIFSPLIVSVILMLILTLIIEYPNSIIIFGGVYPSDEENCSIGYTSGAQLSANSSSIITVQGLNSNLNRGVNASMDRCSDFTEKIQHESNSQMIQSNGNTNNTNLLNKEMHFLNLNRPIVTETSISLPD
ncbi:unnamed protein product [Heterobilharzia americana]|nr:unnamed protein product [Heterobilharzia americana]